ncbi:GLPGLI family protein [Pedobacter polaris]|uniref:GLPGLI family protein n=1 Tax=Pedobacter polaris TaxID=2571273 RepID=A0A4U1CTY1_9SPHI|nr:GLPGLI family protein [Pedobacter polaris]TKC10565.1 GLPGLI family protein [Pedobacter polaris]
MKTTLITLFAIAISSIASAQNPDKALARVRYSFTHLQDTIQKDKPYTENMLLVIGKNASVYTSYDKLNRDLEMQKQIAEQMKNQAGSANMSININKTNSTRVSDLDYFYFAKENKFYTKERLFTIYLVEEEAPKINWKITKDTTSFSGINCQKATAYFKGRNWTAWFASDLPFQSGPWKLNGLPGLVIQAYDETKTVQFLFAGFEKVNEEDVKNAAANEPKITTPNGGPGVVKIIGMEGGSTYLGAEIKLPADAVKTTKKDLDKLKEARDKDPQGFMNAQMAAQGITMATGTSIRRSVGSPTGAAPAKIVINNPIELPETK